MKHLFKTTTISEERSVMESTDSTTKLQDSTNESEEEEEEETLNEKIDRLALETSGDDEDFDVSDRISCFCLIFDIHFFILNAIIKFVVDLSGVLQSICEFEGNSVTWPFFDR